MKKIIPITLCVLWANLHANSTQELRAVIQSVDRTVLSSQIAGKVIGLYKNNGDYFKKGQTLIKIDCDIYQAQRQKVQNKMKLAKVKLDKNKQLVKYNSVGQFEIQTSQIEYEGTKVEYKIASINVDRCWIKAPFTGRVVEKKINRYQSVKPQQELIEIVNTNKLEAKLVVPAIWLRWLKEGYEFYISVDEIGSRIEAKVKQLDSVVDPKSQTINIRATVNKHPKLIAGMSGTAIFTIPEAKTDLGAKNEEK